jgi:hypothetical protein
MARSASQGSVGSQGSQESHPDVPDVHDDAEEEEFEPNVMKISTKKNASRYIRACQNFLYGKRESLLEECEGI